tara:strand:+ start:576 stop:812 length:237 start_codon:yes stop_codon:yes gene_type:complete
MKLKKIIEANPDGTISKDEDKRRKALTKNFEKQVGKWNLDIKRYANEADKIGGTFRGPGIKAELQKILERLIGKFGDY